MNMLRSLIELIAASCVVLLLTTAAGAAEERTTIYQWIDDKGNVNITDSMDKVPEQYRGQIKQRTESRTADDAASQPAPAQPGGAAAAGAGDDAQKAMWQQRIRSAKQKLADAEGRRSSLEQRKGQLASQWGSAGSALPPQNVLDEMKRIDADLQSAAKDAADARRAIDVDIPDEARRAGVPPGWLREVQ